MAHEVQLSTDTTASVTVLNGSVKVVYLKVMEGIYSVVPICGSDQTLGVTGLIDLLFTNR